MKKKDILQYGIRALLITSVLMLQGCSEAKTETKNSVFSWFDDYAKENGIFHILDVCKENHVDTVYQYIERDQIDSDSAYDYIKSLKSDNISTVLIYDEPEYSSEDFHDFVDHIQTSRSAFNITGIITDIEPYSEVKNHDVQILKKYVAAMEEYSAIAQDHHLQFMSCIPIWYDTVSEDLTNELIACSDRIILMNYTKKNAVDAIRFEVEACQDQKKEVENALELSASNVQQEVTDANTYAGSTMEEVNDALSEIAENYPGIRGCYHHIRPLYEMTYGKELS